MLDEFFLIGIGAQNEMGTLEFSAPTSLEISQSNAMTIYSMHEMNAQSPSFNTAVINEAGEDLNVCSFYTGSRSNHIGVPNKVLCLFLPIFLPANDYYEILGKIASRIYQSPAKIVERVMIIGSYIKDTYLITKPDELNGYLDSQLDDTLNLSAEDEFQCWKQDAQISHILNRTYKQILNNSRDEDEFQEKIMLRKKIKEKENQLAEIKGQIQLLEAYKKKNETKISSLEKELYADEIEPVSPSISFEKPADVTNLERLIAEKDANIAKLTEMVNRLSASNPNAPNSFEIQQLKMLLKQKEEKIFELEMELDILRNS